MIINTTAENIPVLSNVGETGEFRIRNSAKAFSILSSGLYSNKIRACIREYSCNAWDSHTMAGRQDLPFDVHLPSTFEPWFAVRDYGIGLDHDGVINIYTTYFESTKSATNDVIGGLGLGSKAAFSITDNFTVTAVKSGRRGIYTAYINEGGVPSVALMMEEATDDADGVEIKFAVADSADFSKFRDEAARVFQYFPVVPNVVGADNFKPYKADYIGDEIMPGVRQLSSTARQSIAVMGNIGYPIVVPNAETNLGAALAGMLNCGMEIHFPIGSLDIQASREGLSYIPTTIEAIKRRLTEVRDHLGVYLADQIAIITNEWTRAIYLAQQSNNPLMAAAVTEWIARNPNPLLRQSYRGWAVDEVKVEEKMLTSWNIKFTGKRVGGYGRKGRTMAPGTYHNSDGTVGHGYRIPVSDRVVFVVEDETKRSRDRFNNWSTADAGIAAQEHLVILVQPVDKDVPMNLAALWVALHTPPNVRQLSSLPEAPPRGGGTKTVTSVLRLEKRGARTSSWGSYASRNKDMVWRDGGTLDSLDNTKTFYYVPVKGFSDEPILDGKTEGRLLKNYAEASGIPGLGSIPLYGIRKADLTTVAALANWIALEDFVLEKINAVDDLVIKQMGAKTLENSYSFPTSMRDAICLVNPTSPIVDAWGAIAGQKSIKHDINAIASLVNLYGSKVVRTGMVKEIKEYGNNHLEIIKQYSLLTEVSRYASAAPIAEYINMVDRLRELEKNVVDKDHG